MKVEIRNNQLLLDGYVNVVSRDSRPLPSPRGKFIEQMTPGVFQRALDKASNVFVLFNHRSDRKLGSLQDGNLELFEDQIGLRAKATISDPEVIAKAEAGELKGWSFGFRANEQRWEVGNPERRFVSDIELLEVSILDCTPAYIATSIEARSEEYFEIRSANTNEDEAKEDPKEEEQETPEEEQKEEVSDEISEHSENKSKNESEDSNKTQGEKRNMEKMQTIRNEVEVRNHFDAYLRGQEARAIMGSANIGSVIPTNVENEIILKMEETSPVFQMARKFNSVHGTLKIARESAFTDAGFVGENTNIADNAISLTDVQLSQKRVGTALTLSTQMVNDSAVNLVDYSTNLLARRVAKAVERSILVGTGQGALEFANIKSDADIAFANISLAAGIKINDLMNLQNSLNPAYLNGSVFIMSREFFNKIALLQDGFGHYYLQNGVINGKLTYTLFGMQVIVSDAMDAGDVVDEAPVFFGNIEEAYAIMIKQGFSLKHVVADTTQALRGSQLLVLDGFMDGAVYNPQALAKLVVVA